MLRATAQTAQTAQTTSTTLTRCTEVVFKDLDADQLSHMLELRYQQGWVIDRIIDHMKPINAPQKVIYYFRKIR